MLPVLRSNPGNKDPLFPRRAGGRAARQQGGLAVGEGWEGMKQRPANPSGWKVASNFKQATQS